MLERLDADQIATTSEVPTGAETGQDYPLVESLIQQLGVPAENVGTILGGLRISLGQKGRPADDTQISEYLEYQIARSREGVDRKGF